MDETDMNSLAGAWPHPHLQQLHAFAHHLHPCSNSDIPGQQPLRQWGPGTLLAGLPLLLGKKPTVGDSGVQLAGQTSPWASTNWNAFTKRRVSSTLRPTGIIDTQMLDDSVGVNNEETAKTGATFPPRLPSSFLMASLNWNKTKNHIINNNYVLLLDNI